MKVGSKATNLLIRVPIKKWMPLFREYHLLRKKIFRLDNEMNERNTTYMKSMSKKDYKMALEQKIFEAEGKYSTLLRKQAFDDMEFGRGPGELFIEELVKLPKFISVLKNILLIIDEVREPPDVMANVKDKKLNDKRFVESVKATERMQAIAKAGLKLGMWDFSAATGEPIININSYGHFGEAINLYLQQANREGNNGKLYDPRAVMDGELRAPSKEDRKVLEKVFVYNPHDNQLELRS